MDLAKVNELWPGRTVSKIEDAFRVDVTLGDRRIVADTHLFGKVTIVPYSSDEHATDASGYQVGRGDAVLSTYFPPGEIGISIEHHRPEYRTLSLEDADAMMMKEHFKLQDSHIGILVGVQRGAAPGVITLNNPQSFEDGRLGDAYSPRIYLRPAYPWYLGPDRQQQFRDNIRTMALGFNAVSDFPSDYNGGDPLAARNPAEVREYVRQMIRAIGGDEAAREWFKQPEHMLYCSEFAFLSHSAGLIVPLNEHSITDLAGAEWWKKFAAQVNTHNAGKSSAFTELNQNPNAKLVPLALADDSLQPAGTYAPLGNNDASLLAFRPMTTADIFEQFMALNFPRSLLGENLGQIQASIFQRFQPGLLELMAMNELDPSDPRRRAVQDLFDRITVVVAKDYGNYAAFRTALEPLLQEARTLSGPRDDSGVGLFVPPNLMHLVAMGRYKGGLLDLKYVGHGMHWSLLNRADLPPSAPPKKAPTREG